MSIYYKFIVIISGFDIMTEEYLVKVKCTFEQLTKTTAIFERCFSHNNIFLERHLRPKV